ncbi:glycoside hydrolase family 3 N-terminal domain-containing protein [Croceivirga sp. JEA036]|uniref:glycoside hydrolase family 3 N-terminal domain-containing protein n=1 Tax=Croceivirga sp. JEA036 TaxID=2721162 RepID=UPI00143BB998|nr:glycoside hydrolase family 3 N-terminal domain-containing protein [Croceivirga sp. JEA036]NJB35106.1 beta-glucosidase [Croceivirga sp. JEA036]
MKPLKYQVLIILSLVTFGLTAQKGKMPYKDASLSIEERVNDLLPRMSLEEKVAQMRIFHANIGVESDEKGKLKLSDRVIEKLKLGIAGIKNPGEHISPLAAAKLNNELQKYIMESNRWGIPALFVTESYNGVDAAGCTKFGRPINSAATFNPELVNRIWDVVGREARLRGMHMCHSPEADLVRDPRFGRMSEAFGEDTYLTTQMVLNAIKGVQGDYEGLGNGTHIGAVAKHFAGYGQVLGGSNFAAIEISPRTLIDEIYPPFEAAVKEAKTLGIMASHGDINGIASHGNPELLTGVLRDQWGFDGYVVSDSNDIARLYYFMKVAESPEAAALMGLVAGIDIDLYAEDSYAYLPEMVKKDPTIEKMIDRSVRRVLRTKMRLGLFDNPYVDIKKTKKEVRSATSLALAEEADLESIILLKNEANTLPLAKSKKKIALLGPLLNQETQEAFQAIAGEDITFVADKGFELTDGNKGVPVVLPTDEKALEQLTNLAKDADVSILFLGGDEFTAKEAYFNNALGDRATIEPVGPQDELVQRIKALGKPVIIVLKHRRTLAINIMAEKADAILDAWDLSEMGDTAIAKVLFGEVSPSGKLPVTVPRSIGQFPFHYSMKEINYKKGYLFLEDGPLYPFGYGLSYGDFTYDNLQLSAATITPTSEITVNVKVTNSGNMKAKEVVQLYLKDEIGSVTRPDKELKGFEKIELNPGETKTVTFTITPKMLEFTGLTMEKILEPGDYTVQVGTSSKEGLTARFRLEK